MLDNLEELKTFKLITSHGCLVGAARQLRITPAAVGRRLANLERKTGKRLFERTTRSLSITAEGYDLLLLIGPIIEALEVAEGALVSRDSVHWEGHRH
jgi:DNA-binding transcriptional LysR family regulator